MNPAPRASPLPAQPSPGRVSPGRVSLLGLVVWVAALSSPAAVAAAAGDQTIVDDQDGSPGFTTTGDDWAEWDTLGYGFDSGDTSYHYLSNTVGGSDRVGTATWTPDLPADGWYQVSIWFRATENRTTDADHYVYDALGGSSHTVVDQEGEGASGWVLLDEVYCTAGSGGCTLVLDGTDDDGSDEANAAMWELVELDGGDGEDGGDGGDGGTEEGDPCEEDLGPGGHTVDLTASSVSGSDWSNVGNAEGAVDGTEATTGNADAGEYLRASGWEACAPAGTQTIDAVELYLYGRTQYESGSYEVQMQLSGGGDSRVVWNGTSSAWHSVDITADNSAWTWSDINDLSATVELYDHPAGNRDSDVWIDGFLLRVAYTTDDDADDDDAAAEGEGDSGEGDSGAGDSGAPPTQEEDDTSAGDAPGTRRRLSGRTCATAAPVSTGGLSVLALLCCGLRRRQGSPRTPAGGQPGPNHRSAHTRGQSH